MSDASASPLLRDLAYEKIKEAIRSAKLQPGEALSETGLSKLLGISRTPVREALQALAQEGLVQIIPGRAVTVAAPSFEEVMDAIHVRYLLEPEVARLVAQNLSDEQLATLAQAVQAMEKAVEQKDRAAWSAHDNVFHTTLSQACPNRLLGEMALQTRNRIAFLAINVKDNDERLAACTAEHRAIVEKLIAGDAEGAEEAMRYHLRMLRDSIFQRYTHPY
ncbi:MAG: GntR family transcriptional regulator [Litorilinea sp.]|nr:MAG: GntR family transcriptional regulator [Litorilinea sp.]